MNEKDFVIEVELNFTNCFTASSKEEAKEMVIDSFKDDYGIELTDKEIVSINEDSHLIIVDTGKKYLISKEDDLYTMYNDFLIDADPFKEMQQIMIIREFYKTIFSEIEHTEYDIEEFEKIALEITEVSELNEDEFVIDKQIEFLREQATEKLSLLDKIGVTGFVNEMDLDISYEEWLEEELSSILKLIIQIKNRD